MFTVYCRCPKDPKIVLSLFLSIYLSIYLSISLSLSPLQETAYASNERINHLVIALLPFLLPWSHPLQLAGSPRIRPGIAGPFLEHPNNGLSEYDECYDNVSS